MPDEFFQLSNKNPTPVPNGQYQDGQNTNQNFFTLCFSF